MQVLHVQPSADSCPKCRLALCATAVSPASKVRQWAGHKVLAGNPNLVRTWKVGFHRTGLYLGVCGQFECCPWKLSHADQAGRGCGGLVSLPCVGWRLSSTQQVRLQSHGCAVRSTDQVKGDAPAWICSNSNEGVTLSWQTFCWIWVSFVVPHPAHYQEVVVVI